MLAAAELAAATPTQAFQLQYGLMIVIRMLAAAELAAATPKQAVQSRRWFDNSNTYACCCRACCSHINTSSSATKMV